MQRVKELTLRIIRELSKPQLFICVKSPFLVHQGKTYFTNKSYKLVKEKLIFSPHDVKFCQKDSGTGFAQLRLWVEQVLKTIRQHAGRCCYHGAAPTNTSLFSQRFCRSYSHLCHLYLSHQSHPHLHFYSSLPTPLFFTHFPRHPQFGSFDVIIPIQ